MRPRQTLAVGLHEELRVELHLTLVQRVSRVEDDYPDMGSHCDVFRGLKYLTDPNVHDMVDFLKLCKNSTPFTSLVPRGLCSVMSKLLFIVSDPWRFIYTATNTTTVNIYVVIHSQVIVYAILHSYRVY